MGAVNKEPTRGKVILDGIPELVDAQRGLSAAFQALPYDMDGVVYGQMRTLLGGMVAKTLMVELLLNLNRSSIDALASEILRLLIFAEGATGLMVAAREEHLAQKETVKR